MSEDALTGDEREALRQWTWAWWLLLIVGLLGVAAGVIVIAKPSNSLATLAVITGVFMLVDGIFELAASLSRATENRGVAALLGVLGVVVGIALIRHPVHGVAAIALLIGLWLVAVGVLRLVTAFGDERHRIWHLLAAAVEIIAGIVIVSSPHIGFAALALVVGIAFIANGVAIFLLGWSMHSLRRLVAPGAPHHPGPAPA